MGAERRTKIHQLGNGTEETGKGGANNLFRVDNKSEFPNNSKQRG
jgi:hypothetical protein